MPKLTFDMPDTLAYTFFSGDKGDMPERTAKLTTADLPSATLVKVFEYGFNKLMSDRVTTRDYKGDVDAYDKRIAEVVAAFKSGKIAEGAKRGPATSELTREVMVLVKGALAAKQLKEFTRRRDVRVRDNNESMDNATKATVFAVFGRKTAAGFYTSAQTVLDARASIDLDDIEIDI